MFSYSADIRKIDMYDVGMLADIPHAIHSLLHFIQGILPQPVKQENINSYFLSVHLGHIFRPVVLSAQH